MEGALSLEQKGQPRAPLGRPLDRANTIGVDARVRPMDPPGDAEVGATEQRVPAIAFPKSDRVDASGAGDAYVAHMEERLSSGMG